MSISYPFPVLGNGDDIEGAFSANLEVTSGKLEVVLSVTSARVEHTDIEAHVENGRARMMMTVECARTYFRTTIPVASGGTRHRIPAMQLEGKVAVNFQITAAREIPEFSPAGLHPDYADMKFTMRPGDVMAIGDRYSFTVDREFDPLRAPVSSIIRLCRADRQSGPFVVELDSDKIEIRLCSADWDLYAMVKNRSARILAPLLAVPALTRAIEGLRKVDGRYADLRWAQRLTMIMEAKGIPEERPPLDIAQIILENPLNRGFDDLVQVMGGED